MYLFIYLFYFSPPSHPTFNFRIPYTDPDSLEYRSVKRNLKYYFKFLHSIRLQYLYDCRLPNAILCEFTENSGYNHGR